jgi:hypothetical protein
VALSRLKHGFESRWGRHIKGVYSGHMGDSSFRAHRSSLPNRVLYGAVQGFYGGTDRPMDTERIDWIRVATDVAP